MKKIMMSLFMFITVSLHAQNIYWQQYLNYNINVQLDAATKSFTANETIIYKNNSPQTLDFI